MSRFPIVTAKRLIKALRKFGFYVDHQQGSHVILTDGTKIVVVPMHNKDLGRGITQAIIKDAELESNDILKVL